MFQSSIENDKRNFKIKDPILEKIDDQLDKQDNPYLKKIRDTLNHKYKI